VVVQDKVYEPFLEMLTAAAARLRLGDGLQKRGGRKRPRFIWQIHRWRTSEHARRERCVILDRPESRQEQSHDDFVNFLACAQLSVNLSMPAFAALY
jgi:hypothetical protein